MGPNWRKLSEMIPIYLRWTFSLMMGSMGEQLAYPGGAIPDICHLFFSFTAHFCVNWYLFGGGSGSPADVIFHPYCHQLSSKKWYLGTVIQSPHSCLNSDGSTLVLELKSPLSKTFSLHGIQSRSQSRTRCERKLGNTLFFVSSRNTKSHLRENQGEVSYNLLAMICLFSFP